MWKVVTNTSMHETTVQTHNHNYDANINETTDRKSWGLSVQMIQVPHLVWAVGGIFINHIMIGTQPAYIPYMCMCHYYWGEIPWHCTYSFQCQVQHTPVSTNIEKCYYTCSSTTIIIYRILWSELSTQGKATFVSPILLCMCWYLDLDIMGRNGTPR